MRPFLFIALTVFFNSPVLIAQSKIDSLQSKLAQATVDSVKINVLYQLSLEYEEESLEKAIEQIVQAVRLSEQTDNIYWQAKSYTQYADLLRFQSSYDESISAYEKGLELSKKSGLDSSHSRALTGIATCYLRKGNFERALNYQQQHIEFAEQINDQKVLAGAYNTIGNIYTQIGEYTKAMQNYTLSSQKYEELGILVDFATTLANIGMIQRLRKNYESAKSYLMQSDSIFNQTGDISGRAYVFENLSIIYKNMGALDKAIEYNEKGLAIYEKMGQRHRMGLSHYSRGNIYLEKENFQEALNYYQKSLDIFRQTGDSVYIAYAYSALGTGSYQMKKYATAKTFLLQAVNLSKVINLNLIAMDASETLSQVYAEEGEFEKAYESHLQYAVIRDSLYTKEKRDLAGEIEAKYQNDQKAKEISLLASENELQALQIQKRENERNYLIAIAVVILLLAGLVYNQYRIKQKANAKLQELDHLKSDFFANISHEFRTPLSLIMAPLKEKIDKSTNGREQEEYQMMYRNADRLFNLINQLLDLSKLEAGSIELERSVINITHFFKVISASFSSLAEYKKINFRTEIPEDTTWLTFDQDIIQKVCYNLLSNAFKFTPPGGEVNLKIVVGPGQLKIVVSDSGSGIPAEDQEKVFDRFFQSSNTRQLGTGIGLALTRELVEFHQGNIKLSSVKGEGATFIVEIPVIIANEGEEVSIPIDPKILTLDNLSYEDNSEKDNTASGPVILIIEDNPDLRNYLSELLPKNYIIYKSADGATGVNKAKEIIPDLIISDVMMPVKDGMEVCQELKLAKETDHIPIILLTARADQESKLQGLTHGADDYLLKPFDPKELKIRVSNLLDQRSKLKKKYTKLLSLEPAEIEIVSSQEAFLKNVMEVVNNHIDDSAFSIPQFCSEVGMSRMQLHRKLTALTGHSASAFMRHQRLIRASQLLAAGEPVSQVAYAVGFGNLSYFTKMFKEQFGVVPSDYVASKI